MKGPRRIPVYGMSFSQLNGVQSTPRIMRGAPVQRTRMINAPLTDKLRQAAILKAQGRVTVVDDAGNTSTAAIVVPAPLQGLESQGLARTLGSLGGCKLGRSSIGDDIEMDAECMRPGEVMQADGSCAKPASSPYVPAAQAMVASATKAAVSSQLLVLGAIAVGAILYFGRK